MIHRSRVCWSLLAGALAVNGLMACSSEDGGPASGSEENTGSISVLLSSVPSSAACLQLNVSGSRDVSKSFDLKQGDSKPYFLDRLPVGVVSVEGAAYAEKCSKLKSSSVPTYVSEKPVFAHIDPLEMGSIMLKLITNGRSGVSVDFENPPWLSTETAPVDLAVIGDTPYGAAQIEDFPNLLADMAADPRVSEAVHVGDIKNGSSRCDDSYFAQIFAGFQSMSIPLVYTPGDNEWTDCHRANNGAYDPVERLEAVRKLFFPVSGLALGGGFKQVESQTDTPGFEKFVENQLWYEASVAFGTVHVVGSNDSKLPWYTDDTTHTKVDDPARRDAERNERNAATLDWLGQLFGVANDQGAKGVVIFMQADMFDAFSVANNISLDAFDNIADRIAKLSKVFGKPVLLIEGDSHVFLVDHPFDGGNAVHHVTTSAPNVTRIVVQGSTTTPRTEWLRLHVDPGTPEVFSWERNAR